LQSNCHIQTAENNKACFEAKTGTGNKSLAFCFLFEEFNAIKIQLQLKPEKTASSKKRKVESLLCTGIKESI
jgi:hypothetical protein